MAPKPSILVVDDSPDGREMLVEYLVFRGFHVTEAGNGAEAIEVARRVKPNIVLMDLSMPGVDGWEATRTLKADPALQDVVVIAVTAHAFPIEQQAARDAGCDAVIPKPYDLTVLADSLASLPTKGISALAPAREGTAGRPRQSKASKWRGRVH